MVLSYFSALQRDTRQDEFPTTYRGIQDEFPTTHFVYPLPQHPSTPPLPTSPSSANKWIFGLRKTTFLLSLLALSMLALGIVGSGVAGSIAANRKTSSDKVCQPERLTQAGRITTISISASSPTSYVTTTQLATATILSSLAYAIPSDGAINPSYPSNCQNMQSPYTAKISNALFDVSCETQNLGGDFINFESTTLENCIDACANFNFWSVNEGYSPSLRCSIINFDSLETWVGNCWLKASGHSQPARTNQSVTTIEAVLQNARSPQLIFASIASFQTEMWIRIKFAENKLAVVQKRRLHRVTGAYKATPIRSLETEIHVSPIQLHLNHFKAKARYRLQCKGQSSQISKACKNVIGKLKMQKWAPTRAPIMTPGKKKQEWAVKFIPTSLQPSDDAALPSAANTAKETGSIWCRKEKNAQRTTKKRYWTTSTIDRVRSEEKIKIAMAATPLSRKGMRIHSILSRSRELISYAHQDGEKRSTSRVADYGKPC
ncbi:hypothetical protein MMC29_003364 [Sticta canariensis]|nr:hypothetical protein [Sticta canariensis]